MKVIQLDTKRKTAQVEKKWAKDLYRHVFEKDIQITGMYVKICSTSIIIQETQIQITVRYHLASVRIFMNKKQKITNIGIDV